MSEAVFSTDIGADSDRHDDLKPHNILVHGSKVLLTDFGFW